ncbi:MAG: ABC transporter substrate-binding protein [Mycobacteriaceae bacterium]|nr:ABC transporter substrate-binding protein [Mycobacteriaceae bacterium]
MALLCAAAALLAGCVTNVENSNPVPTEPFPTVRADPAAAALLPARVRQSGRLVVGVNVPYTPNEFRDSSGRIVGFDVDLVNAVAAVLGVTASYVESTFEKIIPAVTAGTYDMGMSSFTDNVERQKTVDFVDYFRAGVQWARRTGSKVDPDNACGLRVAVQATTVEDTDEVPGKSARCVAAGKPALVKVAFEDQSSATTALMLGQVDAMSADSPATQYAVRQTDGSVEPVGPIYDAAPYGWPVPKGSPLAPALRQALQKLIDTGAYRSIAARWGVQSGMIDTVTINNAGQ